MLSVDCLEKGAEFAPWLGKRRGQLGVVSLHETAHILNHSPRNCQKFLYLSIADTYLEIGFDVFFDTDSQSHHMTNATNALRSYRRKTAFKEIT